MIYTDVLCVGATAYDFVYTVEKHPGIDEKIFANSFTSCGGGPASNAAIAVSRFGLNSALCAYLGNDLPGKLHFKELQSEGVNTDLVIRGRSPTPVSSVIVKPNGERLLVNYGTSKRIIKPHEIDFSKIETKIILFDGHQPDISLIFQKRAEQKGIITVLDAGSVNTGTSELYQKVNYLVCSKKFAFDLTKENQSNRALNKLYTFNNNVVITLGDKGVIWKTKEGEGKLPAIKINAVDTTGAGDVFHGAFVYCLAKGVDLESALKFSNTAAGLSCKVLGARKGIPRLNEVEEYLNKL